MAQVLDSKAAKIKVAEADQEDTYKGIVRIDSGILKELGIRPGSVVKIEGKRETVALVDRALPSDLGLGIIRMDGLIRSNAGTSIGEYVFVKPVDIKEAKRVAIAPARKGIVIQGHPLAFKKSLLGRPVLKGDIISLGGTRSRRRTMTGSPFEDIFDMLNDDFFSGFGVSGLRFLVVNTDPKDSVLITENTEVEINPEAVAVKEERVPDVTYEDIGGLTDEIKKVREMIELPLRHPEVFERLGVEPPKGVLLHGPPGTGKTLIAKAVANESGANFISINGPEIVSKFVGEAEKNLRKLFEEAEKNAPSIIFIDEIDAIAPKREESFGEVERRIVAQLLASMDGLKSRGRVVVIAATNRPNALDPALRRGGRFDREIEIGVPDKAGRLQVFKIHTRNMPIVGRLYSDILERNVYPLIDEKLEETNADILKKEQEIEECARKIKQLELGLAQLERDKRSVDRSFLDDIVSAIKNTNQKIRDAEKKILSFKEEIKPKKIDVSDLVKIKETILKDKQEFQKLTFEMKEIEETRRIYGEEDERTKVKNNKSGHVYKRLEELEVVKKVIDKSEREGVPRDLEEWSNITHGFVGADIEIFCKEAAMSALRRILPDVPKDAGKISEETLNKLKVIYADFQGALKMVSPSAMREILIETPKTKWIDIGGLEQAKQELIEAVEWPLKHPQAFENMGIRPPRGVLLFGPPGCGKTMLVRAAANGSSANFISIKGPELLSKWLGESEKGVREIFRKARQVAPTIIFFDEMDALAPRRGEYSGTHVTESVVSQILTEMDGLEELTDVVVIAATNRPELIDRALLRPGRFDRHILIGAPDEKARLNIFQLHTKNIPLTKDVDIKALAKKTENYSGADIQSLCREAAMHALRLDIDSKKVTAKDFEHALKETRGSLTENDAKKYRQIIEEKKAEQPNYMG